MLGLRSHPTAEQLRAEAAAAASGSGTLDLEGLSSEINRTLLELWKMENIEFLRSSR